MRDQYIKANKINGFSIVELMVALAIGAVIMVAVTAVLVNNNKNYTTTDSLARLQENARFTMNFLTMDLRRAGYLGCADDIETVSSTLNGGYAGGGAGLALQPMEGINGVTTTSTWAPSTAAVALPADAVTDGTSDAIAIRYLDLSNPIKIVQEMPRTSARLFIDPGHGLQEDDIIAVADCDSADIMQLTKVDDDTSAGVPSGKDGINHNSGGGHVPGNSTQKLSKVYGEDATVMKLGAYAYYISEKADGTRSLSRTGTSGTIELVEGIESMHVTYGEVTTGDRIPTVYRTASAVTNWRNVISVRIAFIASTIANTRDGQLTTDTPLDTGTYTVNDATYDPVDDRRIRKVFTSTIMLRNMK